MVEMINALTGSLMTVTDNRVDEYLAAGHRLAVVPTEEKPKTEPKKATTKKATTKKK